MADTLRTRVARVISGGAHALLDQIEDTAPVAMLEQSVREVDRIADEVRAELGRAVANRHLAQQQHLHLNKEHDSLAAALATAMSQQRDDLARPAIARQLDIEAQLPVLEASLGQLGQDEKELTGYVDALMGKKREMERAIRELEASRRLAESTVGRGSPKRSLAEGRLEAAKSAFDRTYQRQAGLVPDVATLEQAKSLKELNDLVRENKISERLAALKAGH